MVASTLSALAVLAVAGSLPAPAVPVSIREMIELTDLSSISISPDGRLVAFRAEAASIQRNNWQLDWYVVPTDGAVQARRIGGAGSGNWLNGTLMAEPPQWTRDSDAIVYRATVDGEVQLWRAAVDGRHTTQISHDPGNVRNFAIVPATDTLVYSAGASRDAIARAERVEYDRGVRIDASIDPARPLYRGAVIDGRMASERLKGFWFGSAGLLSETPLRYRTLDLSSFAVRDATDLERALLIDPVRPFDAQDGRIVIARAASGDGRGTARILAKGLTGELAVIQAEPGRMQICNRPQCRDRRLVSADWLPKRNQLIFATVDPAASHGLHRWDIASGAVHTIAGDRDRLNGGRDDSHGCAISERTVVCVAAAADMPPHLVAIDLASGRKTTLAAPNQNLIRPGQLRFEALAWSDAAGKRFTGQLMMPAGGKGRVPLVITYYVCDGYLRGGTGDELPLRQFAEHGIAALCINRPPTVPGHNDQIGQYRLATAGVVAAIDLLAARGLIDREKVGMGGLSFGGEVTMWTAVHTDRLSALSISNALLSETYYWFSAMAGRDVPDVLKRAWGIGPPDLDPEHWQGLATTRNTGALRAPLLMQMPEQEYRVNMELAARLSRSSTPMEFWVFPEEAHVKFQPRHKLAVYQRNLDWFRYWLQGVVDPDPDKVEQYRQWQASRRSPKAK